MHSTPQFEKNYTKNISKSGRFCPIIVQTHYGLAHYGLVCILNCWALRLYTNLAVQIVDGFLLVFYAVVCRVLRRFHVSYLFSFQVWSLTQFFLLALFVKKIFDFPGGTPLKSWMTFFSCVPQLATPCLSLNLEMAFRHKTCLNLSSLALPHTLLLELQSIHKVTTSCAALSI